MSKVTIERVVRDAIVGYQELYRTAPNDEASAECVERATVANAWLESKGYAPEPLEWSREEVAE